MSSRSMRLRSFASVVGARHRRGRSRAKARTLPRCSGVRTRVFCAWNFAASALTSSTRDKASFHRRSRLAATRRLDGIDLLVPALGQGALVLGALDAHLPLAHDGLVALLELVHGGQGQLELGGLQGLEHLLANRVVQQSRCAR